MILTPLLFWMYKLFIKKWGAGLFKTPFWCVWKNGLSQNFLSFALSGYKPRIIPRGNFLFTFYLFCFNGYFPHPSVEFFPENQPKQILVFIEYPEGTAIKKTNTTTRLIESEIFDVIARPLSTTMGRSIYW